jgi:protein TonB
MSSARGTQGRSATSPSAHRRVRFPANRGGDWWSLARARRPRGWIAPAVAIAVHVAIAGALLVVNPARLLRREQVVEMEVHESPPPPPEIRPERPPPPPPEPAPAPKPRIVPRRVAVAAPKPPPPTAAPPPPNQEPPKPTDAPPVFGVTLSSTVAGDKSAMAVPVGNTLMTKDRTPRKPGEVPQPSGTAGARPFAPVADVYIADPPRVVHEINSADIYPPEAYKMGIEGKVVLKVSLDSKGNVVQVRIIGRAGHGFDEAARDALRQFKFTPARTSDGQSVDYSLTYTYVFDMSH